MRKKAKEPYRNGDVTLGRSGEYWVADFDHVGKRKRKRLCKLLRPEAEAKTALNKFAESRRAIIKQQTGHTVGTLWKLWLAERAKDGLSNKIYGFQWVSMKPHFENRTAALLTTDDCREYARTRFASGKAQSTVNTELSRLRACLKWAAAEDYLIKPPKVWVPQAGKPREIVLTPDEAGRLIHAARGGDAHIYVFVVLLFATGARHRAILDLTWDRVDFVKGTIEYDEDLPPDPMSKSWRKGRAWVVMSKMAREALLEAHRGRLKNCHYVIAHGGRRLKTCREGFSRAVGRAGLGEIVSAPSKRDPKRYKVITDITPHTIRHTVATWLDGKVQTTFTASLLGHGDEATTRKVYTHSDAEATRPAVQIIDATFDALPEITLKAHRSEPKAPKKRHVRSIVDQSVDLEK